MKLNNINTTTIVSRYQYKKVERYLTEEIKIKNNKIMMWKAVNGGCLIQTSQKSNPSVYDDYNKRKGNGVITIGKQLFYFSNNRELKRILRMKKSLLVA